MISALCLHSVWVTINGWQQSDYKCIQNNRNASIVRYMYSILCLSFLLCHPGTGSEQTAVMFPTVNKGCFIGIQISSKSILAEIEDVNFLSEYSSKLFQFTPILSFLDKSYNLKYNDWTHNPPCDTCQRVRIYFWRENFNKRAARKSLEKGVCEYKCSSTECQPENPDKPKTNTTQIRFNEG